MSPEIAVRPPWRNIFSTPFFKEHLTLVAVDEAHCIPEWLGSITRMYGADHLYILQGP